MEQEHSHAVSVLETHIVCVYTCTPDGSLNIFT